jgi:hypothetical protein
LIICWIRVTAGVAGLTALSNLHRIFITYTNAIRKHLVLLAAAGRTDTILVDSIWGTLDAEARDIVIATLANADSLRTSDLVHTSTYSSYALVAVEGLARWAGLALSGQVVSTRGTDADSAVLDEVLT